MIKIKKQLYEDMYHPIFSQEVNNQRISIILIPPARPLLMTSKGNKVPVNGYLESQELRLCSEHLKLRHCKP